MPIYNYRCDECHYEWEEQRTIAERNLPLDDLCPDCGAVATIEKFLPSFNGLCYTVDGVGKTPDTFNDLLKNIKKNHRGSTIQTR